MNLGPRRESCESQLARIWALRQSLALVRLVMAPKKLLVGIWGLAYRSVRGQRLLTGQCCGRQRRLPLLLRSEPVQPYLISVMGPTEPVVGPH